ncbi:hypothetical protein [Collimonas pratensis]|uniref:hypothetical protein n=1 Tax=Collimonas TaxID=202907 RepID=UPI000782E0DC|nr:hypothetical protein [Collimonas pratensis]
MNDLWTAGWLVLTAGTRGRAFCAIKPEAPDDQYNTLRCHCCATFFIEALALRKHQQSLAFQEGFALDEEAVFIITMTCSKCRQSG